jgi:hypothetical protein
MAIRFLSAAGLILAGSVLAACQTIPAAVPEQNQRLCTDAGAPPGSPHYEECLAAIEDAIAESRQELYLEYGYISTEIKWDCEMQRYGEQWWIRCHGEI